jgi:hypothetical protein
MGRRRVGSVARLDVACLSGDAVMPQRQPTVRRGGPQAIGARGASMLDLASPLQNERVSRARAVANGRARGPLSCGRPRFQSSARGAELRNGDWGTRPNVWASAEIEGGSFVGPRCQQWEREGTRDRLTGGLRTDVQPTWQGHCSAD